MRRHAPGTVKITEREREREFYRYYHPTTPATPIVPPYLHTSSSHPFPLSTNPSTSDSTASDEPLHFSQDPTLTAFAQLGALKLNAARCLITFFSRTRAYVLAESTPGVYITSAPAASAGAENGLCWGSQITGKGLWVCETTVQLPTVYASPDPHTGGADPTDITALVIPDLSLDERFNRQPYVTDAPHARFYAGVPIRSPAGHNIGAFCVLDGTPRPEGITDEQMAFMKELAVTVMRHMEMVKEEEYSRRWGKMVRGLGAFVEGRGDTPDGYEGEIDPGFGAGFGSTRPLSSAVTSSDASIKSSGLSYSGSSAQSSMTSKVTTPDSEPPVDLPLSSQSTSSSSSVTVTPSLRPSKSFKNDYSSASDITSVFRRAARVMRESTEVDGALFLDGSITTFGGLVEDSDATKAARRQSTISTAGDKPCGVLGYSLSEQATGWSNDGKMTEQCLKGLLQRYPRGRIFDFDPSPRSSPVSAGSEQPSQLDVDVHKLSTLLPRARSLVMLPLYVFDHTNGRPFAAAFIWTCDQRRVFRESEELAYLAAFGNSVMAEVARCDAARRDRAKADFISGVSHELRSPLHGILGCVELMLGDETEEIVMNPWHRELAGTIETCGRTLLDTINHVLDFAKINNVTKHATQRIGGPDSKLDLRRAQSEATPSGYDSSAKDSDIRNQDVDLATLTEEVVETVYAGFQFRKSSKSPLDLHETTQLRDGTISRPRATSVMGTAPLQPSAVINPFAAGETAAEHSTPSDAIDDDEPVKVIVEIQNPENGWNFRTQPGAWRRILMNLFGNSLKYTDSGFIKVKLECFPPSVDNDAVTGRKSMQVVLTVTDSGRGMSPSYLRDHLFHPFAQEDPLSPGTGLGLSIIKQIVGSMGGRIDVRSEKGCGSEFSVLVDLEKSLDNGKAVLPNPLASQSRAKTVAFVGFDEQKDLALPPDGLLQASLSKACQTWCGLEVQGPGKAADVYIATEGAVAAGHVPYGSPLLVLCPHSALVSSKCTSSKKSWRKPAECVKLPCGPRKLAKALQTCLSTPATTPSPPIERALVNEMDSMSINPDTKMAHVKIPSVPMLTPNSMRPLAAETAADLKENVNLSAPLVPPGSSLSQSLGSVSTGSPMQKKPIEKHLRKTTGKKLNVLMVDDNYVNLSLLVTFLKKKGHTYETAQNGLEAVNAFKSSSTAFDFVLMDITMPVMDGLTATRLIRAHEKEVAEAKVDAKETAHTTAGAEVVGLGSAVKVPTPEHATSGEQKHTCAKIVALTGLASDEAKHEAFTSGIDVFLTKPVRLMELNRILEGQGNRETSTSNE
ncbi:hypothetical protein NA57DRAFT_75035 [Rhizodiscina lignyota]|uniref:histidine kinase n=1 Tax=Rhizodiscina lignyota TaxID=1504668 RepID=A0A9P4M724_9PEZI|nr:hypothetical protein NA57DRAFT_75035 [Rhizodiscina lignyota]